MWSSAAARRAALITASAVVCALGSAGTAPSSRLRSPGRGPFEECRGLVRTAPDDWRSYDCFLRVSRSLGDVASAVAELEAVLARDPERALAKGYLANLLRGEDPQRAERLLREAAAALRESDRPQLEVYQRIALADLLDRQGRVDEAGEQLELAAIASSRAGPAQRSLVQFEHVRHEVEALEDYGRAWRRLRRLEPEIFPDGSPSDQHRWLEGMGTVLWYLGRYVAAFEKFQRDAELLRDHGDRGREAMARSNMALLAPSAGLEELKEPLLREALALAVAAGNRAAESVARARLSELVTGEERVRLARRAVELVRGREQLAALAVAVSGQDPARALELIDEAGRLAQESGNRSEVARNAHARSRLLWRIGPRSAAIAASLAALDAAEEARNLQPDSEIRARRFAQWRLLYQELVGHLLAHDEPGVAQSPARRGKERQPTRDDLALAFTVLERHRARSLLDDLDAAGATAMVGAPETRLEYKTLLSQLNRLQRELLERRGSGGERRELQRRIASLELDVEEQSVAVARADPRYGQLRRPELATLDEVQEALEPDGAILVYHLAEVEHGGSFALLISRDRVAVGRLSPEGILTSKVGLYLGLIRESASDRAGLAERASSRLYSELLPPAVEPLVAQAKRLVIVPAGPLYGLPFGTLTRPGDEDPLVGRVSLVTVPSVTAWLRWRRAPARTTPRALALVDPTVLRPADSEREVDGVRGWEPDRGLELGELPFARKEGKRLVRSVGNGSRLLVGPRASESFLKHGPIDDFSVLHFGAHAIVDTEDPVRSALVLAPGAEDQDGLLQLRDIVQLDLSGSLVVLAACQSASGAAVPGEGFLGLTYGFFVAGSRTVVGSLWPLGDEDAAELFSELYRRLTSGESVADALAGAQRERRARGAPVSAWAGVVVLGDGELRPFPKGVRRSDLRGVLATVAVVLGAFGVLAWARRRTVPVRR